MHRVRSVRLNRARRLATELKLFIARGGVALALGLALGLPALAEEQPAQPAAEPGGQGPAETQEQPEILLPAPPSAKADLAMKEVTVIGSKASVLTLGGSGAFVDTKDIQQQNYADIDRVLRRVPGVYVRGEDGYGLFPNISLRGVATGRSEKVTIMEDGILTAPAPYSAPAAYYFPSVYRMNSVEILKGSSQIKYGPHTTGGVINLRATQIPMGESYFMKTSFGNYTSVRTLANFGNTLETRFGKVGFLVENWFDQTNGFKTIDTTPDFRNGTDTGFTKIEPMLKLAWEPNSANYQRFDARFGYTSLDGDQTYLGLTDPQFRQDPFRRLAASRFDNITTSNIRTYVRHYVEMSRSLNLTTTVYGQTFERNWAKLNDCRSGNGGLTSSPTLGECLENPLGNSILSGTAMGAWRLRNNDRSYYLYGVEPVLNYAFQAGPTSHSADIGFRYHYDQVRRFQTDENITQAANGVVTNRVDGTPGAGGSRREQTTAYAFYAQDTISIGRFSIKPGIRYEHLSQDVIDLPPTAPRQGHANTDIWAGGASLVYALTDQSALFGGIHRGFSVAAPEGAAYNNVKPETSIGYEIGARHQNNEKAYGGEVAFFFTRFDNLIVTNNVAASGALSDTNRNVGAVNSYGVELKLEADPAAHFKLPWRNPVYFAGTYTNARIRSNATDADQETIFSGAIKGNRVPYIPEFQWNIGSEIIYKKWSARIDAFYQSLTFATGNNSSDQFNPVAGVQDARFGRTDAFWILDVSSAYQMTKNVEIFVNAHNITGTEYIVTRQPAGPQPGSPQLFWGGLTFAWSKGAGM
jgi:Fe(3+) dicitrate transport protein